MVRLFFHNKFDKNSIQQLSTLPTDNTVKVFDVFGDDKNNLPSNITLSILPYLVDKSIVLSTQAPYSVGTVSLTFNCLDHTDTLLTTEESLFYIYINGDMYQDKAVDGVLNLTLTISQPMSIEIKINNGNGYIPFDSTINVN